MNNYRSQCGEDQWLDAHWQTLDLPDVGFFVDFGAGNGERFSNSYWLEKEMGWRGLLCEPNPDQEIVERQNSIIERVAIGWPVGKVMLGLTEDPDLAGFLRHEDGSHPRLAVKRFVQVDCVPISALLEKHGIERVDLISVDTEGTELEAWRTLELSRWRPQVAIIEYSTWNLNDDLAGVVEAMRADGYSLVHTTTYNGIFVA